MHRAISRRFLPGPKNEQLLHGMLGNRELPLSTFRAHKVSDGVSRPDKESQVMLQEGKDGDGACSGRRTQLELNSTVCRPAVEQVAAQQPQTS